MFGKGLDFGSIIAEFPFNLLSKLKRYESVSLQVDSVGPRMKIVSGCLQSLKPSGNVSQASGTAWFSEKNLVVVIPVAVQDNHTDPARGQHLSVVRIQNNIFKIDGELPNGTLGIITMKLSWEGFQDFRLLQLKRSVLFK